MNGPTYSEDGQWIWDGNGWVPAAQPQVPVNNVPNQYNNQMQVNPQQMQVNPQSYSQTPGQVVVYSSPKSRSSKPIIIVVSLVIGVALLVILAGVLYSWASSLAEDEIEGIEGCGDKLTMADFAAGSLIDRWIHWTPNRPCHANVETYYERLAARPAYKEHVIGANAGRTAKIKNELMPNL